MMQSNPEAEKVPEYAAFDLLRFLLATGVLLYHLGVLSWGRAGNLAVTVFFALSGWLIGGILYKTKASELSRFYYNRTTRIWIPYFFTLAVLYTTSIMHESAHSSRWYEFLGYDLTFTHNWFTLKPDALLALSQMPLKGTGAHFWSLAVEEQFYLIAPLIITLLPFGRKVIPWLCIAALAFFSGSEYSAVSFGILAVIIAGRYPHWHLRTSMRAALLLIAIVTAILLAYPNCYVYAAPIFAICVVLLCAQHLRRNALTRWLGGISFPFYLNAWMGLFVLHALQKHFRIQPNWYSIPLEIAAGLAGGCATYYLIDVQVMARRNRFYRPALGWALGATGYVLVVTGVVWAVAHTGAK